MKMKILGVLFALVLALSFMPVMTMPAAANGGNTWYVDGTLGTDDGSHGTAPGANAFRTIQYGINAASSGDTINVAAGTYIEDITLKNGVQVLGAGASSTTIFGTGIGTAVTTNGVNAMTKLDGFTITNGSATFGGGMHNYNYSSVTVSNCTFDHNSSGAGGGMFNDDHSSPTVDSCTFSSNSADGDGGGMYNNNHSSTMVSNCTFSHNSANDGGGMYNQNSSPTIDSCTFSSNPAMEYGGGMCNWQNCSPAVSNCTFSGNSSGNGGGMENYESSPTVTNCTFSSNTATDWAGGMVNTSNSSPTVTNCTFSDNTADDAGMSNFAGSSPTVTNCILWGDNTPQEINNSSSTPTVTYCDVEGGYAGTGNINTDPLFVGGGDYHLTSSSPCIDAGSNSAPSIPDTDFEGDPRIIDGNDDATATVDMGVDEYAPSPPTMVWVDDNFDSSTIGWGYDHFATIQDGIDAVAGSIVHVAAGTYHESITLVDGVQVLGAGADVTTIDATSLGTAVNAINVGSGTELDGFTIYHGNAANGGGMYNYNSSAVVSNCTFDHNSVTDGGGGMYNEESSPTVTNCTFSHNSADYGGGMYNLNSSSPTITNCTFYDNSAPDGAGMLNDSSSPTITNCTFYGNSADDDGGGMYNDSSSPTLTNCILWGDSPNEIYDVSSTPVVTYCDVQGGYAGDGNISVDPLFADPGAGDFHLTQSSPCIDAGNNDAPSLPDTDFEGDERILDGNDDGSAVVDMGVDEYEYIPPPPPIIHSNWASTTPTIDGVFGFDEWSDATVVNFLAADPNNELRAYAYFKNDASFLYIGVDVPDDTTADEDDATTMSFDTGNDGVYTNGHDDTFEIEGGTTEHFVRGPGGNELHCSPFDTGLPRHAGLAGAEGFGTSPHSGTDHRIYEYCIPLPLLLASAGDTLGFGMDGDEWMGIYDDSADLGDQWPVLKWEPIDISEYGELVLASPPVGGELFPVNKLSILAPWLALALLLALGGGLVIMRRRFAR